MPPFNPIEATISTLQTAFREGAYTCIELVRFYLDRIARLQDAAALNAVACLNPLALEIARDLDRKRASGLALGGLHGVPVLLKDNINTKDMPTSNGSAVLQGITPPYDAFIAERLRESDALILGKASMGEFAGGHYNTIVGTIRNPYATNRSPSGSSGGSAAAVAANMAMLAVGTDTSSSVRGPAAVCGVVGIRPTTGLVSRCGIVPKNLLFDTAGPIARTVEDAALLLDVMAGEDARDPASLETHGNFRRHNPSDRYGHLSFRGSRRGALMGARLGVVSNFLSRSAPEIQALFNAAVGKLQELGAEIVPLTLDERHIVDYVDNANQTIRKAADCRFREDFERYLATLGDRVPKTVQAFVDYYKTHQSARALTVEKSVMDLLETSLATSASAPQMQRLLSTVLPAATAYKQAISESYRIDAMIFPSTSNFAELIETRPRTDVDPILAPSHPIGPAPFVFASYSSIGNPEITVPMGFDAQGLPMTISIMGKPCEDGRIISFAHDYERVTRLRRPPPL